MVKVMIIGKLEKVLYSHEQFFERGLNVEKSRQEFEEEAWRAALDDRAVKEEDRPNVRFIVTE